MIDSYIPRLGNQYLLPTFLVDSRKPRVLPPDMQLINSLRAQANHYEKMAVELRATADRLQEMEKGGPESANIFHISEVQPPPAIRVGVDKPLNPRLGGGILSGAEQIVEALKAHNGGPMKRKEIWAWMEARGTKLAFNTFKSYLSTRFKSVGWDQWTLPDEPASTL